MYALEPLDAAHSESLFLSRIFGSEGRCPLHLKEASDKILKRCGGLPLAIVTVASLLATKGITKEEWEKTLKSIGSALEIQDTDVEEMKKILLISYNDLPYHLKTCLLYLGVFPEDYEIKRDRLIRRWVAEGFITAEGGQDMEEIGECYFNDLINRSMIQPVGIQCDGRADACRVHDMVLDLIVSKSAEENFLTLCGTDGDHRMARRDKARRLSINYHARDGIVVPENMVVSNVRSLTIFGHAEDMPALSNFLFLRVLDLENRVVLEYSYLRHIGRLRQLRYLRLSSRRIAALPEQIGDLQNLQTLDLRWTRVKRLPRSVVLLRRLTCLLVNSLELPEGIGNMQALQELSEIEINRHTPVSSLLELGKLTNLRILGINWCIIDADHDARKVHADSLVTSLCKLGVLSLRSIQIQSYHTCSLDFLQDSWFPPPRRLQKFDMSIDYHFPRTPKWMVSLEYLSYLDIYLTPVDEESFRTLGDLPSLLFLWISSREARPREGVAVDSHGFRCLREFYFTCWEVGTGLAFEPGAMPALEKLRIPCNARGACSSHAGVRDLGIGRLSSSLRHLQVEIVCRGARLQEVEAVEEAVRNAANEISDELFLGVSRWDEEEILKDEEHKLEEAEA